MKNIFALSNATHGVNDDCIASYPRPDDQWQCNFAQHAYAHTKSPTFPLNSALDSWQTVCIYTSELPPGFPNQTNTANGICGKAAGYNKCAGNPESCNQTQIKVMNQYITDFDSIMSSDAKATYTKAGNGAFVHSCHTHCEAQGNAFFTFQVNGVSMQQAVSKWWNSDGTDPASAHSYTPCMYKDGAAGPRKCNPTC
jgi:STAM-binding protein